MLRESISSNEETRKIDRKEIQRIIRNIKRGENYDSQAVDFIIEQETKNNVKYLRLTGRLDSDISFFLKNFLDSNSKIAIIPLNVSAEKGSEIKNHFTGLYIRKEKKDGKENVEISYKVYYIDPTGLDTIPNSIVEQLSNLSSQENIIKTTNKIQSYKKHSGEVLELTNNDCGSFVSDLLVGIADGSIMIENMRLLRKTEESNSFRDIGDLDETTSRRLGKELREKHCELLSGKEDEKHSSNIQEKITNPLDNLARLLQGNSVCAAVCLISGKLLFTFNELTEGYGTRGGSSFEAHNNLIEYLYNKDKYERKKIFKDICYLRLSEKDVPTIKDEYVDKILQELLENKRSWKDYSVKSIVDEGKFGIGKQDYEAAARIIMVYAILDRTRHDFDRSEQLAEQEEFKNSELELVCKDELTEGAGTVHAELRLLNHLLNNYNFFDKAVEEGESVYLGISKICCLDCYSVIGAVNKIISEKQTNRRTDDNIKDAIEHGKSSSRETHGLDFENWLKPDFITSRDFEFSKPSNGSKEPPTKKVKTRRQKEGDPTIQKNRRIQESIIDEYKDIREQYCTDHLKKHVDQQASRSPSRSNDHKRRSTDSNSAPKSSTTPIVTLPVNAERESEMFDDRSSF